MNENLNKCLKGYFSLFQYVLPFNQHTWIKVQSFQNLPVGLFDGEIVGLEVGVVVGFAVKATVC